MAQHESHRAILDYMRTHFREPPELIYYDNACNLQEYVTSRDPATFWRCQFMCVPWACDDTNGLICTCGLAQR